MRQTSRHRSSLRSRSRCTSPTGPFRSPSTRRGWETRSASRLASSTRTRRIQAPRHPGAAHYLIHLSDVHPGPLPASFALQPDLALQPTLAQTVLPAAYAYADIAPDAEHAQHMPSHVFLKLGLWDEQVASNEHAW